MKSIVVFLALSLASPMSAIAQTPLPGAQDVSRIAAGRYEVDTDHTFVAWTVNHMGISPLSGAIAASGVT